jgi:HlyD family secretion protein
MTRPVLVTLGVLGGVALTACALWFAWASSPRPAAASGPQPAVRVETIQATREDLKRISDSSEGELLPFESTELYANISGFLSEVQADIGDPITGPRYDAQGKLVQEGQVLARVCVPELVEEVKQKEAQVEQAKAEVTLAQKAFEAAQASFAAAGAQVDVEKAGRARSAALIKRWQTECDFLKTAVRGGTLDRQTLEMTEYELEAAKATAVEVEAKVKAAEAMRDESAAKRDKAGAEVGAASARLQVAQADRDRVKALLDYTRVVAPYDGVVTRRNLHSGAFLSNKNGERPPIFTVMRTDRLRIIVDIAEKDVRFLDVSHPENHPVQMTLDALPGKQFVWPLKRFAPVLGGGKKVRAEIEIPNPDKVFFPGMYGHAAVILETKKRALTVPAVCLSSDASGAFVWLVVDGQAKQQRVTIGLNDGKKAEILSGLTGTEQIITSGKDGLREGQAVVAVEASSGPSK